MNTPRPGPIVYCISTGKLSAEGFAKERPLFVNSVKRAADLGFDYFQIREKSLPARLLFELSEECGAVVRGAALKVLVNGRADIAIAAGLAGVHLPADGVPTAIVRRNFGNDLVISVSVHSHAKALVAQRDKPDLVLFGPVFASPGKGEPRGLAALADVCSALGGLPVIALGGVTANDLDDVIQAGAAGFASIRYLNGLVK